jgi:homoserine O-acetyltransferase
MIRGDFTYNQRFNLESNEYIEELHLAYHYTGKLNATASNVIWVFHALTGNSNIEDWWPAIIGKGKLLDPTHFFIICVNMPGSCYGSSGPLSINPATHQPYLHSFPLFTIHDMVRAYALLKDALGIRSIMFGIGGSMGGQQLLAWAAQSPSLFKNIIPITTNAKHSNWGIAFNQAQRNAIEQDANWGLPIPESGTTGMKLARAIAMLSYRHYKQYEKIEGSLQEERNVISYQLHQGEKLAERFNAISYWLLSKAMDLHHLQINELKKISANTMVIGIDNDILFPVEEQQLLAAYIPKAIVRIIRSDYGHDGFLLETAQLNRLLNVFVIEKAICGECLSVYI